MSRLLCWVLVSAVAVSIGCTSYDMNNGGNDDTGQEVDDTADTDDSAPSDSGADEPPAVPSWIRLDGVIAIASAEADPTGTTLAIEYRLDPAAETDEDADASLPCTRTPVVTAATPESSPDAAVTLGWWAITFDATADPLCTWTLPADLHVGLGTLDPQLYAAMDLAGLATSDSGLYGLYVQIGGDSEPVWVYGVAGTTGQFSGIEAPVTAPPLPDGLYTLQALHLIPFTP